MLISNGAEKLVWSLNDYLDLANAPRVRRAHKLGVKQYGLAYPMGARMMTGNTILHEMLEAKLSSFIKK